MKTSRQSGLRENGRIYTDKVKTKPYKQFWCLFGVEKAHLLLHEQNFINFQNQP